ncbi:hypothetical protein Oter_4374 [Opitutus terrae PB90-1]|uniref:Uncharacterized protein n=2 Tax=Opitutus terrae TaxID=107709 RepID=B1ZRJ5_OPITP|nr:hypothetical protein Oter_4374 [Opitutus terrae PB90-1]
MRSKPNVQASVDLRPPEPTGVSDFAWDAICTAVLAGLDGVLASSQHGSFESSTRASLSSTFAFAFVAGLDGKRSLLRPVPIFSTEQSKFLAGDQPLASNPAPEAQFATAFALEAAQAAKEETIGLFGPLPRQRTEGLNDSVRLLANHHRVFIPIHIEGVPWLVLILFLSGPEHQRWYHTFHYYRDVVPRIGAALRTVTKSTYLHVLTRLLAVEIDDREQEALDERFNRQSRVLTQYFPFPQVELTKFSPHGIKLTLPRQDPVSIEFRSNRHFQRATALAYDLLDTTSISDALNRTVVQALDRDVSFHQEMDYQAHTLFNEIPSIQLEAALNSRRENLAGKARDFVTAARAKLSILEVSLSIPFAEEEEEDRLADFTSVIVLLRWFETIFAAMGGKTCKLTIAGADITLATSRQRADVFTVLWNLWHNAAKIYARSTTNEYSVTTAPADGGLSITFRNEGVMPMDYVRYLTNADGNPPVSKKRGLRIVKAKVAKLGWPLPTINVTSKSTSVTLVVNNPSISPHERKTAGG